MTSSARKALFLITAIFLSMSLLLPTSCSILDRSGLLSNQMKIEMDACKEFEEAFFEALEKKDEKKIRKLFSPRALQRADDLDEGIAYLFELYGGGKVTFEKDNRSSYHNFEKDKNRWEMHAYCFFTDGETEYRVNWVQFLKYDEDERMLGVYQIDMIVYEEGISQDALYLTAGIHHPGRSTANHAIGILDTLYQLDHKATDRDPKYELPDESAWNGLWDPDVYASLAQQDKDDMAHFFIDERSRKLLTGWFEFPKEGGMVYYCAIRFALHDGSLGIRFNDDGLITGMTIDIYRASFNTVEEGLHGFDDTRSGSDSSSGD